ncbi:hypothetical protein CK203_105013 [Vitis vinifera]|uniref:Uncharacterized protein n=1 Tax=Vitis vinifera TaxID=29760 RepID=A0A438BQI8_VITVI|nr:hypothetical protein CK203_105013 [Vitis vinifera]
MESPIPLGKMMENESSVARVKIRQHSSLIPEAHLNASLMEIESTSFKCEVLKLELLREHERYKEEQVEELKHSMQSGMAQVMKEQAQLREEMAYQYKVGSFEAADAIQRRLDPDVTISMEECFVLTASVPHAILINCSFVLTAS